MNSSITFLAQLLGPVLAVIGIMVLFGGDKLNRIVEDFKKSEALLYLSGVITMTCGITWLLFMYSWNTPAEIIFTIWGMLITIKGAMLIIHPHTLLRMTCKCRGYQIFTGVFVIAISTWLLAIGYGI